MDTIFMKSDNCKTSDPHILLLSLSNEINLKRSDELPDGSYSVSDIQDYFDYIIKKHEIVADNFSIRIYLNKIENRITFKIKTGYYL